MDKLKILVQSVEHPTKDDDHSYYSLTSVDGYALLGAAKYLLGLDYSKEKNYVFNGDVFGLRAAYQIKHETFPPNTTYLYSSWVVNFFAKCLGKDYEKKVVSSINTLPVFSDTFANGAVSYCSPKCNYIVPNVQAMAVNLHEKGAKCLRYLQDTEVSGNWRYARLKEKTFLPVMEDIPHLAFMIVALDSVEEAADMVSRMRLNLDRMYSNNVNRGRINNTDALFSMATKDGSLKKRALKNAQLTLADDKENFRARCWCAYALALNL